MCIRDSLSGESQDQDLIAKDDVNVVGIRKTDLANVFENRNLVVDLGAIREADREVVIGGIEVDREVETLTVVMETIGMIAIEIEAIEITIVILIEIVDVIETTEVETETETIEIIEILVTVMMTMVNRQIPIQMVTITEDLQDCLNS